MKFRPGMRFALYPYWLGNLFRIKPFKKAYSMRKFTTAVVLFSFLAIPFISYAKAVNETQLATVHEHR